MRRLTALSAFVAALAACSSDNPFDGATIETGTVTGFVTPQSDGTITHTLADTREGVLIDANGDGYSFVLGTEASGDTVAGYAGTIMTTAQDTLPTTGSVAMSGTYAVAQLFEIDFDTNPAAGTLFEESGPITLTADFDGSALTGSAGNLTVSDTLSGYDIGGTVIFNGLTGELDGLIRSDVAAGAFTGQDDDTVYVGGFRVDTD